jgi:hypothetical protein
LKWSTKSGHQVKALKCHDALFNICEILAI